jgi:hypothetical protein
MNRDINFFGETNARNHRLRFGIKRKDRRSHFWIIGKTGTGKSSLLKTMIEQDIANGDGVALLDPHGDLVERIKVPPARQGDFVYFNACQDSLGFNPLESVLPEKRPLAASALLDVFKKIWADSWGPRLEHIMRNCLLTLLDQPAATLADLPKLLTEDFFRKQALVRVKNQQVFDFWSKEYNCYPPKFRAEAIAPLQNKVGAFLANPVLCRILSQTKSSFDLRHIMDNGKILLVNLAKGKIGADTASLLGALLVARIEFTALSRVDLLEESRRDFYLYLDEFPTFTTDGLASMLSELRKYRLNMILAHQFLAQLGPIVREGILGNVGTMICFRIGASDAELLEQEFFPPFTREDMVNLPDHSFYLKLMIDGQVSEPFSATSLPQPPRVAPS